MELLVASAALCITGAVISTTFSKEIDLCAVTRDYQKAVHYGKQKLFELESVLNILPPDRNLSRINEKGPVPECPGLSWSIQVTPHPQIDTLFILEVTLEGIHGQRELKLTKWSRVNPGGIEKERKP